MMLPLQLSLGTAILRENIALLMSGPKKGRRAKISTTS
jgi:hypothetical protein